MPSPYEPQLLGIDQAIKTFASEVRQQINISGLNATDYGVPYFTGAIVDGREMWGVVLDFGNLPNATAKALLIPTSITNEWSVIGERWIDSGNSFVYNMTTGFTLPLPHSSNINWDNGNKSSSDQIYTYMTDSEVIVGTESDRTDYKAVITLKYLKEAPA